MASIDAKLAMRMTPDGVLLVSSNLLDQVVRQERRDAGVAEHHQELGQPGPAEVGVLARVEDERAEELPDGEPLRGLLVEAAVLQHGDEQQREHQARWRPGRRTARRRRTRKLTRNAAEQDAERRRHADDAGHLAAALDRHLVGDGRVGGGEHRVERGLRDAPADQHDPRRTRGADQRRGPRCRRSRRRGSTGGACRSATGRAVGQAAGQRVADEGEQRADTHDHAELRRWPLRASR